MLNTQEDGENPAQLIEQFAKQNEQGFTPELEQITQKLTELAYETPNTEWQAEADYAQGVVAYYTSQRESGLRYLYSAAEKFEHLNLQMGLLKTWTGMAILYNILGQPEKSLEIYQKTLLILEAQAPSRLLAQLYTNLTNVCASLKADSLFLDYNNKAINLSDKLNIPFGRALGLYNLGFFYFERQAYEKAKEQFEHSLNVCEKHQIWRVSSTCLGRLGDIALLENQPLKAIHYAQEALLQQKDINDLHQKLLLWELLAAAYEKVEDWKKANHANKQVLATYKEVQGIETTHKINELNIQYESKKKEIEIQQAQLARTQAELKALRSQMNPHFIYNTINAIQGLIYNNQSFEASDYLSEFSFLMRKVLEMSGQEWVSLSEELDFLNLYLSLEKLRFGADFEYELQTNHIAVEDFVVPALFLQPLVENALRHGLLHKAGAKHLSICFTQNTEYLHITITDNGIGRQAAAALNQQKKNKPSSYATSALEQRAFLLNSKEQQTIRYEFVDLYQADQALGTQVFVSIRQARD
jgi:tetratricopeptide (TPR) repeat protein